MASRCRSRLSPIPISAPTISPSASLGTPARSWAIITRRRTAAPSCKRAKVRAYVQSYFPRPCPLLSTMSSELSRIFRTHTRIYARDYLPVLFFFLFLFFLEDSTAAFLYFHNFSSRAFNPSPRVVIFFIRYIYIYIYFLSTYSDIMYITDNNREDAYWQL